MFMYRLVLSFIVRVGITHTISIMTLIMDITFINLIHTPLEPEPTTVGHMAPMVVSAMVLPIILLAGNMPADQQLMALLVPRCGFLRLTLAPIPNSQHTREQTITAPGEHRGQFKGSGGNFGGRRR